MRLFLSCLCGLFLTAAAASQAPAGEKIRFVTLEFAPFIYGESQQVAGPGRDIIEAVCAEAKLDCSYDIYPWRRAQELMKNGDADGMMVIGRNPKREEWIRFSPPHFRTEYGFFVNSDNVMDFTELSQLQGFKVGVFAPSNTATQLQGILYYAGFARSFPDQTLIDRFDAAWRELFRRGEAQAIIRGYGLEPAAQE